ncbi:MAG: RHS repeat-associated core domain-containing protein [Flavobacteriales bacterium]|nr:RHS repeat-associated core domain-containing protein [Flavobacteriales bacterium]
MQTRLSNKLVHLFIIILYTLNVSSQIAEEDFKNPVKSLIPPAPTSSALAKYADVPVGEFTGIPSISIPIYDYQSRKLQLPLSLSYHAGGIKVDEVSSWIGLGWSLNAGGVITKSIVGHDDLSAIGYQNNAVFNNFDGTILDMGNNVSEVQAMMRGHLDGEPDVYYYNFNGKSGKFVFDHQGTLHLIPKNDLKIERDLSFGSGENAFKITDTDGTIYYFGGIYVEETIISTNETANSEGPCTSDFQPPSTQNKTSWFLYKIENPIYKDVIQLNYLPHTVDFVSGITANEYFDNPPNPYDINGGQVCKTAPESTECETRQTSNSFHLNEISASNGFLVKFITDHQRDDLNGGVILDKIEVYDRGNNLLKTFELYHDYFVANGPQNDLTLSTRLKLDSVKEIAGSSAKPPYIFSYLDEIDNDKKLPRRLSYAQDHWGFYNGQNNNPSLLPKRFYTHLTYNGADRDAYPKHTSAGMLYKIKNPTGGETEFDYECNSVGTFSLANITQSNAQYESKHVSVRGRIFNDGDATQSHGTGQVVIPYPLYVDYTVMTENTWVAGDWNGEILITNHETGQSLCHTTLPCGGSNDGQTQTFLRYFPAGTYDIEVKATVRGDNAVVTFSWDQNTILANQTPLSAIDEIHVGGARIKSINYYDGRSHDYDRFITYEYKQSNHSNPNRSSGKLITMPRYDHRLFVYRSDNSGTPQASGIFFNATCSTNECFFNGLSSFSKAPLGSSRGSHVVYPEVSITYGHKAQGGKTKKIFSFYEDKGGTGFPYASQTSYDWKRGHLLKEIDYRKNEDGSFTVVRTLENDWDFREDKTLNNSKVIGLKVDKRIQGGLCQQAAVLHTCTEVDIQFGACGLTLEPISPNDPFIQGSGIWFSSVHDQNGLEFALSVDPNDCEVFGHDICFGKNPGDVVLNPAWTREVAYRSYEHISQWVYLKSQKETIDNIEKITEYLYDETNGAHTNPIQTTVHNSDGTKHAHKVKYAFEYQDFQGSPDQDVEALYQLKNYNVNVPIETLSLIEKPNQSPKVVSGSYSQYAVQHGVPLRKAVWTLELTSPLPNFIGSHIEDQNGSINLVKSANYKNYNEDVPEMEFLDYNVQSNLLEYKRTFGNVNTMIWDNNSRYPIADVQNALQSEVAYTSFEQTGDEGGWQISGTRTNSSLHSGRKALEINKIEKTSLPPGTYEVSFWHNGQGLEILLNNQIIEHVNASTNLVNFKTTINASASLNSIAIRKSGVGPCLIDDARLGPVDSRMQTFVYDDESDLLLSISNDADIATYYQYDLFQRLKYERDENQDILSVYDYVFDQSTALNFISTKKILVEGIKTQNQLDNLGANDYVKSISYQDGFVRPIQNIVERGSINERDVVTIIEYDSLGRQPKSFLPFTKQNNQGQFVTNAKLLQNLFFGSVSDAFAYSESEEESSPLGRSLNQAAPGSVWSISSNHTIDQSYRSNYPNEVRIFKQGTSNGFYPENTLHVVEVNDENGNTTTEYHNIIGQLVMKKNGNAETYTLYDDFGRVDVVIPATLMDKLNVDGQYNYLASNYKKGLFKYTYNAQGLLARKDLPGTEEYQQYYDRLERLVLVIDPNGVQTFTKYDALDRPTVTGLFSGSTLPSINDGLFTARSTGTYGYDLSNSFPSGNIEPLLINFYDDHDLDRNGTLSSSELISPDPLGSYATPTRSSKGLLTASKVAYFEEGTSNVEGYTFKKMYYDDKDRIIQSKYTNFTGVEEVSFNAYSFSGHLLKAQVKHRSDLNGLVSKIIEQEYVYDRVGRKLKTYQSIDGVKVLLNQLNYNEKDQVISKSLGASDAQESKFLQKIDYAYNIRNWITAINSINGCSMNGTEPVIGTKNKSGNTFQPGPKDLFSQKLFYNNPIAETAVSGQFNGNVSGIQWQSSCGNTVKFYGFEYNNTNQLTNAVYGEGLVDDLQINNHYDVSVGYDNSGNISQLTRKENAVLIDDLKYDYNDHFQLETLEETSDQQVGFQSNKTHGNYQYDSNGNMKRDDHKNMSLSYNFLNLPSLISYDNQNEIRFRYDALGTKLQQWSKPQNSTTWSVKSYFGSVQYLDGQLEAIYHDDGRAVPNGNSFIHEYDIKDHLGNPRVRFADFNNDGEIKKSDNEVIEEIHYYPFGMVMNGSWNQIGTSENKYQYNMKEHIDVFGLNWLDYGARFYDPSIGRWSSVDPLAEEFLNWSPYNYVMNNPLKFIDPTGMAPETNDPEPFIALNKSRTPSGPHLRLAFDVSAGPHTKSGVRTFGIGEKVELGASFKVVGIELLIGITENYLNIRLMNTSETEIVFGGTHVATGGSITLTRTVKDGEVTTTREGTVHAGPVFITQSEGTMVASYELYSSSLPVPLSSGDGRFFSINASASIENVQLGLGHIQGDASDGYSISFRDNRAHVRSRMADMGRDINDPHGIKAAKRKEAAEKAQRALRIKYYNLTGKLLED